MTTKQKPPIDTEALEAAARLAAEEAGTADTSVLTLSTGLRLRIKPTPAWLIQRAATTIPRPEPPRIHIEEADRWEDNPSDPTYTDALLVWESKTIEAGVNVMLATGTEVEDLGTLEPVEGTKWLEIVEYFGVALDSDLPVARYLLWLTCYALSDPLDFVKVVAACQRRSGIAEEDAVTALQSFRNRAERRAANDVPAEAT